MTAAVAETTVAQVKWVVRESPGPGSNLLQEAGHVLILLIIIVLLLLAMGGFFGARRRRGF